MLLWLQTVCLQAIHSYLLSGVSDEVQFEQGDFFKAESYIFQSLPIVVTVGLFEFDHNRNIIIELLLT